MGSLRQNVKKILSSERAQGLVEFALVMCFALVMVAAMNLDSLRNLAQEAYVKGALSMGGDVSYQEIWATYGTLSSSELHQIDNDERIAIDQATIRTLAGKFLGMSKNDVKALLNKANDNDLAGKGSNPYGVILFDYDVINTGDDGNGVKISLRENGNASASNLEAMQWMQGNYDTEGTNYSRTSQDVSSRLFYSDDTIDPNGVVGSSGTQSATVRAIFSFDSSGKVDKVTVNVTRSKKVGDTWQREVCSGLNNIVVTK